MAQTESEIVAILPSKTAARLAKYRIIGANVTPPAASDHRRQARKDRDKVVYATSWRRLGGVTQVVTPDAEDLPVHTRLTHSQKVAQVATSIADHLFRQGNDVLDLLEELGGLDLHIVEFAALAHDLGHPPFGHVGEAFLDDFAIAIGLDDGFEGNAQTLRTLVTLARWTPQTRGLPICAGSLASVTKYPWKRGGEAAGPLPTDATERKQEASRRANTEPLARYWKKFGAYQTGSSQSRV